VPGFLERLKPWQRNALMIGVPAVAVLALMRRRSAPAAGAVQGPPIGTPSTDAIGVGQLAEFESGVSQSIFKLGTIIEQLRASMAETAPQPDKPEDPKTPDAARRPAISNWGSSAAETEASRIGRLVDQVTSGTRTLSSVRSSLNYAAGQPSNFGSPGAGVDERVVAGGDRAAIEQRIRQMYTNRQLAIVTDSG
jgi:hypothetical protein